MGKAKMRQETRPKENRPTERRPKGKDFKGKEANGKDSKGKDSKGKGRKGKSESDNEEETGEAAGIHYTSYSERGHQWDPINRSNGRQYREYRDSRNEWLRLDGRRMAWGAKYHGRS